MCLRATSRIRWIETRHQCHVRLLTWKAFGLLPELDGLKHDAPLLNAAFIEAFGLLPELDGLKQNAVCIVLGVCGRLRATSRIRWIETGLRL